MPRDYGQNSSRSGDDVDNPWSQYRRLVLQGLDNLDNDVEKLDRKLDTCTSDIKTDIGKLSKELSDFKESTKSDITALKVKAGFIGAIAGSIFSGIVMFVFKLLK